MPSFFAPYRLSFYGATLVGTALLLSACGSSSSPAASAAPAKVTVSQVTNWFAEPEQGGQWDAQLHGLYAKEGLAMTTLQGGPQVSAIPLVAAGKDTFGMANADQILLARQEGVPIVAILAVFQTDPQVLIWHQGAVQNGFAGMSNRPVYVSAGSDYWTYIVDKYHLKNDLQEEYNGTLTGFIHTPNAVIQGYLTEEPYTLAHEGVAIDDELVADSGFNPYANVLFTTESEIKNHPTVVKEFVAASIAGWKQYFASPASTDAYMKQYSPDLSTAGMLYAVSHEKALIEGGDAATHGIGWMSAQRWQQLDQQMVQMDLIKPGVSYQSAYTNAFLPTP